MLRLAIPSPDSYVQEHLTSAEKLTLVNSPYRSTAALFDDALVAYIDSVTGDRDIWTRTGFDQARDDVSAGVLDGMFATVALVSKILAASRLTDKAIKDATSMTLLGPLGDARAQLDALIHPGFVAGTGVVRLRRIPVYLAGITHRVSKLAENTGRDRVWMAEVQLATDRYLAAGGQLPLPQDPDSTLARARWMLEELRLSLFAQHLGTAEPVSLQRITKILAG